MDNLEKMISNRCHLFSSILKRLFANMGDLWYSYSSGKITKGLCKTMEKTNIKYDAYIQILKEELCPAMGCTEPIALAYAAAVARKTLGELPDKVVIGASGSIIKNVKSVIVPKYPKLSESQEKVVEDIRAKLGDKAEKNHFLISPLKDDVVELSEIYNVDKLGAGINKKIRYSNYLVIGLYDEDNPKIIPASPPLFFILALIVPYGNGEFSSLFTY